MGNKRLQVALIRSLTLSLWSHVSHPSGTLTDRCHQANTDSTNRHIHMLFPFCFSHMQTHEHAQWVTQSDPHIFTQNTLMCIYGIYIDTPPQTHAHTHSDSHTHSPPDMQTFTHWNTHAYHAPHPCRCSGACLASIPLSLHPSLASNPSLRRLPSVDQRCKTLPPAP